MPTNPIIRYFKESREELAKVTWPSRQDTVDHTILVVVFSLALAAFFGALDYVLNLGLEALLAFK